MSRIPSLYLIDPAWDGDADDYDQSVVDEASYAYGFLETAPELWKIAGREDRANAIESIVARPYEEQTFPALTTAEIDQLLILIDGIEDALIGKIVDKEDWSLSNATLAELRKRKFKRIDFADSDAQIGKFAVGEAITRVQSLRNILLDAKRRGLHIGLPF